MLKKISLLPLLPSSKMKMKMMTCSLVTQTLSNLSTSNFNTYPKILHPFQCHCCYCSTSTPSLSSSDTTVTGGSVEDLKLKNLALEEEIAALKGQLRYQTDSIVSKEDPDIAQLLANNRRWVASMKAGDPNFFKKVGGKQEPKYLYIGCSDSRVPANEILGLGPGEVFTHRNVGSQVIGSDLNVLSCIEYAVQFLDVKHIIVAGHYDCGAVRAAMKSKDLGLLENWLRSIRDVYRMHHQAIDMYDDEEERHRKLVEYSVVEQCLNLYKTGVVQRKRKETHAAGMQAYPRIHAMVFDPKVGILQKLPIDFKTSIEKVSHIYDLY